MTGISWSPRTTPLTPVAVLGRGSVAAELAGAIAERVARGVDLEVHAAPGAVLAFGAATDLPWVDGATWLGRDGRILTPTTLIPGPDSTLVGRAIGRATGGSAAIGNTAGGGPGWVVVLPDGLIVGERSAGRPDLARLRALARSAEVP
jgi:MoxR-vWA-beta-propeller ternary system protein